MKIKALPDKLSALINIDELVFDLTLSAAALVVYRLIVPKTGFLLAKMDLSFMIAVIIGVQFFTAMFFAGILKRYDELGDAVKSDAYPPSDKKGGIFDRLNKRLLKTPFIGVLLIIAVFFGITGLFIVMPGVVFNEIFQRTIQAGADNPHQFLEAFVFFLTGISVILPGVVLFKADKTAIKWFFIICIPFAYEALAFPFSIVYFASLFGAIGAILFVLITAAFVTGIILLKRYFEDKDISSIPVLKKLTGPLKTFVIPFLTAAAMIAWSEISLISSAHGLMKENLAVNMANIFPYLLMSGLVPIRAVILFAPPVKPLNILISAASFCWFFITLDSVLGKIPG